MSTKRKAPVYELLPRTAVERLHEASLTILERVGVCVPHQRILNRLAEAGARVEGRANVARLPPRLVEQQIGQAAGSYTLYGRNRTNPAAFGQGAFNQMSSSGQHQVLDWRTGRRRAPILADVHDAATLGDALPGINIVGALAVPSDVPPAQRSARSFVELLKGTTKPIAAWVYSREDAQAVVEILRAVAGGAGELRRYPLYEGFVEPISPLSFRPEALDILEVFAEAGLPIGFGPMAQVAATAPCTLAGTVAQENAEILACVVISQLLAPGLPVTYWGIPHVLDLKTTSISFGSPEQALMAAAHCQLAASYGLPVGTNTGLTDAKTSDEQAGAERGMTLLLGALCGSDIFGHRGIIGADCAGSLVELVIENEIVGYVQRIMRSFEVTSETLALEAIERVGIGGSFLADDHTLEHWREDVWLPSLFDRRVWDTWLDAGGATVADVAKQTIDDTLARHQVEPLDAKLAAELERIVAALGE